MGRLTETDGCGNWNIKGLPWESLCEGQVLTEEIRQILYGCLCKLKDYEDIGPAPEQLKKIDELFLEICKELGQLKQKVNDAGWIPVEQQLPESEGSYITTTEYGAVRVNHFYSRTKSWGYNRTRTVAWMPLPKPYRPEEDI